jgi:hypothetical protein
LRKSKLLMTISMDIMATIRIMKLILATQLGMRCGKLRLIGRRSIGAKEHKEIRSSVIGDLVERFHLSPEDANNIFMMSLIEGLIRKHPYLARHYPIKMLADKVWSIAVQKGYFKFSSDTLIGIIPPDVNEITEKEERFLNE